MLPITRKTFHSYRGNSFRWRDDGGDEDILGKVVDGC